MAEEPKEIANAEGVVGPDLAGSPLDAVVRALFGLTWGKARDLVKRGKIKVEGRISTNATARLREGTSVAIDLHGRDPRALRAELPREAFVHVDAHLVVVDKPAGVSTVPFDPDGMGASIAKRATKRTDEVTLDQRVKTALAKRERAKGRSGPPPDLGIVHRLDKETTGLIVFTRTFAAKKALAQAFRFHHVHRRYLALVHGDPRDQTITSHFVEDRGDGLRGSVEKRRGRQYAVGSEATQRAVTHVEVLERFPKLERGGAGQPAALVACRLETGRTHQIRIHLAEAGHPLLGERVYIRDWLRSASGAPHAPQAVHAPQAPIAAPRVMLHAAELGFTHPATEEALRWTSPLPADFEEMVTFLRGPRSEKKTRT